ncbi:MULTISPECIES: TetR family transcriptional regulator [unclassified Streptomyces]|uniref:TetR/AcrR family transcriptional regulator n=1 Tax=unclassified Streptomyces TaxID=2593676 RepID=UPI003646A2B5
MSQTESAAFQRARRPEQIEIRKQTILDAAEALLGEMPIAEISLRELSRRVGLSKTNVVRYFETREAVFLELLRRSQQEWLDTLEHLPPAQSAPHRVVCSTLADSLAQRPLLCELWSALATVLERNVSLESVRAFKLSNLEAQVRFAGLVSDRIPELGDDAARELAALCTVAVAGLWPFANPSPTVLAATEDPRLAGSRIDFATMLSRHLDLLVTGLLHRPAAPPTPPTRQ